MTKPRRVFDNTPEDQKPSVQVFVRLEGSCACHFGDKSHGARIGGGWSTNLLPGHSACDVMALACAVRVESELAIDAMVKCIVSSGATEEEARAEIANATEKILPMRRAERDAM